MLDHLTLHVKDIDRSITFYKQALAPLGYIVKAHHEPTLGFGVDDGTLHSISTCHRLKGWRRRLRRSRRSHTSRSWLTVSKPCRRSMQPRSPPAAETTALPGPRPYHPGYYSAFVLDPDGNNIEAVVDWAHSNE